MFDFPNSPATNQRVTGSGGQVYTFDGTKWVATATLPGVTAWNSRTGNVTMTGGDVTTALAYTPYDAANPSGYQTAAQVTATVAPTAQAATDNVGRNLIANPVYTVQQRGTGPWTAAGYTADRWTVGVTTDAISFSITTLVDNQRTAIGDEAAAYCLTNVFTGNAAAGACNFAEQRIENVRRLSNRTVTVSFWAVGSASQKLGVSALQFFGSGGSPTVVINGVAVQLSTSWTRFSITITLPSIYGMTLGTAGDYTAFRFWYSSGATNNTQAGGIGVQSGTVQLWGMQLEYGNVATPLAKRDPADELALCQRFYQTGAVSYNVGINSMVNSWTCQIAIPLQVAMRASPTTTYAIVTQTNCTGSTVVGSAPYSITHQFATSATTGGVSSIGNWTASADL